MNRTKITQITASGNSMKMAISELLRNPGILVAFTYRDLKIRYVQTLLGYLWSVIQPLLGLLAVFILFFKMAGISSGGVPYLAFALSGLVFWNYFNYLVTQTASSFVSVQAMIKKIYFPRLSIPFSKAIVGIVDLLVGLLILALILIYYGLQVVPLLVFPLILLFTLFAAAGLGLLVSALSIRYRDLQQALPFTMQILFFLTPVAYPTALLTGVLPESWLWVTYVNPMTGILELFRHFLFGMEITSMLWISLITSVILFVAGIAIFTKVDKKIADLI